MFIVYISLISDKYIAIHSVSPLYGPEAGGTLVTLRGHNLAKISYTSLKVLVAFMQCDVVSAYVYYRLCVLHGIQSYVKSSVAS